jgi:hypothetical protein
MADPPKVSAETKNATNQDDGKLKETSTAGSKPDAVVKEVELPRAVKEVSPKSQGNKTKSVVGEKDAANKSTTEPGLISGGSQCETKQDTGGDKKGSSVPPKKSEPGKTQEVPALSAGAAVLKPPTAHSTSSTSVFVPPGAVKASTTPSPGAAQVYQTKIHSGGGVTTNKVPSKDAKPSSSRPTTTTPTAATKAPEGAGSAPSNKKRKHPSTVALSSGATSAARPTTTATPNLADFPAVSQMVQNVFTLLETCK